jgi:copper chaperone
MLVKASASAVPHDTGRKPSKMTPPEQEQAMEQVFTVSGMSCGHCERAITQALQQVDPQAQVHIDRTAQQVRVESTHKREDLALAIAGEGYQVQ